MMADHKSRLLRGQILNDVQHLPDALLGRDAALDVRDDLLEAFEEVVFEEFHFGGF